MYPYIYTPSKHVYILHMYIHTQIATYDSSMVYVLFLCMELSNAMHMHTHFYPNSPNT